jgi:hypothetical protein
MSGPLVSLVGKKILAESARNHFGTEVSFRLSLTSEFLFFSLAYVHRLNLYISGTGPLFRRGTGFAVEPRIRQEDSKAAQGNPTRPI